MRKQRFLRFCWYWYRRFSCLRARRRHSSSGWAPLNPAPTVGNFPAWYQDNTAITLEFCDPQTQSEVDGGWCLLLPGDVTIPEVFPTNFFDEHFYFAAGADANPGTLNRALLVLALESAFATGQPLRGADRVRPHPGSTCGRIPTFPAGTYRFIHPYGEDVAMLAAGQDRIFFTDDVGIRLSSGHVRLCIVFAPGPVPAALDHPGRRRNGPTHGSQSDSGH